MKKDNFRGSCQMKGKGWKGGRETFKWKFSVCSLSLLRYIINSLFIKIYIYFVSIIRYIQIYCDVHNEIFLNLRRLFVEVRENVADDKEEDGEETLCSFTERDIIDRVASRTLGGHTAQADAQLHCTAAQLHMYTWLVHWYTLHRHTAQANTQAHCTLSAQCTVTLHSYTLHRSTGYKYTDNTSTTHKATHWAAHS